MAVNVIEEEMEERSSLALAAEDTEDVVRAPDHIVKVLDANGRPLNPEEPGFPMDGRRTGPSRNPEPPRSPPPTAACGATSSGADKFRARTT